MNSRMAVMPGIDGVAATVALMAQLALAALLAGYTALAAQAETPPAGPLPEGSVQLTAAEAMIHGPNARLEGDREKDIIWWTHEDTSLQWDARIQNPGTYRVEFDYSVIGNNNGRTLAIMVGDQVLKANPKAGSRLGEYELGIAGEVTITKPGTYPVVVKPFSKASEFVLNLRSISLVPASFPSSAADISDAPIKQASDGSVNLEAIDAKIVGMNAQLEGDEQKNIGFWKDRDTSLNWTADMEKPGKYRVEMNYSLTPGAAGSKIAVSVGDQVLKARPAAGKNWTDYKTGDIGEVDIDKPGNIPVSVKPLSIANTYVINLRSIVLVPADRPGQAINIADTPVTQGKDGTVNLTAADAEIDGATCRLEGGDKKYVAWWNSPFSSMQWPVAIRNPGLYSVQLTYSLANAESNSEVELTFEGQTVHGSLAPGRGLDEFKTVKLGELNLEKGSDLQAVLNSTKEPGGLVMHFASLSLVPVGHK